MTSKVSSEFGFRVQELGLKSDFSMFQTWLDFKFSLNDENCQLEKDKGRIITYELMAAD